MNNAESKKKAAIVCRAVEEKKGLDLKVIEIAEISTLADYFIISSGSNENQVQAIIDSVDEMMSRAGYEPRHTEGKSPTQWMLLDYGDVVVHIFNEEGRSFYDLEHIWRDGKEIDPVSLVQEE
ncbi:MAG: ribosome silencing factor [Lachnospiraceae bacterium]|nr:ribosome silencing factor [Lachnospiraceae bacterium]